MIAYRLGSEKERLNLLGDDDPDPNIWMTHRQPGEREVPRRPMVQQRGAMGWCHNKCDDKTQKAHVSYANLSFVKHNFTCEKFTRLSVCFFTPISTCDFQVSMWNVRNMKARILYNTWRTFHVVIKEFTWRKNQKEDVFLKMFYWWKNANL